MAPIDFIPKHSQPFTLDQAMQLEISVLVAEIQRLENSITHLQRTQDELVKYIQDDPDGDEDGEIGKAKEENDSVIASQKERISMIKVALMNKIGEGGMKHYGLVSGPQTTASRLNSIPHDGVPTGVGSAPGSGQTIDSAAVDGANRAGQTDREGQSGNGQDRVGEDDGVYL